RSAPQCFKMLLEVTSCSIAYSRCSRHTNSCRRFTASVIASCKVTCSSRLIMMLLFDEAIFDFGPSLFFHHALKWILCLPRQFLNRVGLCLRHLEWIHARDSHSVLMHVQ